MDYYRFIESEVRRKSWLRIIMLLLPAQSRSAIAGYGKLETSEINYANGQKLSISSTVRRKTVELVGSQENRSIRGTLCIQSSSVQQGKR